MCMIDSSSFFDWLVTGLYGEIVLVESGTQHRVKCDAAAACAHWWMISLAYTHSLPLHRAGLILYTPQMIISRKDAANHRKIFMVTAGLNQETWNKHPLSILLENVVPKIFTNNVVVYFDDCENKRTKTNRFHKIWIRSKSSFNNGFI